MSKDILFSNSFLLCYGHCLMVNPVFLPVLFQGFGLSKGGRWSMSSNETVLHGPAAQFFLFLVQWTDCQLAGVLGLLRILIYMVGFFPPYNIQRYYLLLFQLFFVKHLHISFPTVPPPPSLSLFFYLDQNRNLLPNFTRNWMWQSGGLMQTYADGKTTMSVYERKSSIREFYGEFFEKSNFC